MTSGTIVAKIFISYSRADRVFLQQFLPLLRRIYGNDAIWYDDEIHGGIDWWEMILSQVRQCDLFIYLLTNDSVRSNYCHDELREAIRLRKQILPVIIRPRTELDVLPEDLRDFIRRTQYVDLASGVKDTDALTYLYASVHRLLEAAATSDPTPLDTTPLPPPVVNDKPVERTSSNWLPWVIATVSLLFAVGLGIVLLSGALGDDDSGNDGDNTSGQSVDATATETDTPETLATVAVAQDPATNTTALSPTDDPTNTPTPDPTQTNTLAPTVTATPNDATLIIQTDVAQTATRAVQLTATATLWTATPSATATSTPNRPATLDARRTETATLWTLTPTDTATPSNTPTATNTPTETSTATSTPTSTPTRSPLELAQIPVENNEDWEPYSEPDAFGVEMVLVPVGDFEMGSNAPGADSDENPHLQSVTEPFYIDVYEVTNADFAVFLNAQGNRSADGFEYLDDDDADARITQSGGEWQVIEGYENHPVIEVTWFGARDYCLWRDARLPTELEWEYAASGPSNWEYPWGDDWNPDNAVWNGNNPDSTQTAEVGTRPQGASWVGAMDMSGNVWEWVSSLYMDYPYGSDHEDIDDINSRRVLRGGSWLNFNTSDLRAADRFNWVPDDSNNLNGFRCARS
jgi:formylglycine-generating enzyme required for sulfatase activity